MTAYPSLDRYGLIGNLETCALISDTGSVDWFPYPQVDSPTVFAALLDANAGGYFRIQPTTSFTSSQRYLKRTNVLQTTFRTDTGTVTVTDFMPVYRTEGELTRARGLYRKITCVDGAVNVEIEFVPRFNYARTAPELEPTPDGVVATGSDDQTVSLATPHPVSITEATARTTTRLTAGDSTWVVLTPGETIKTAAETWAKHLQDTIDYWRNWAHTCNETECVFGGPWHDLVVRSALVLKLLTYHETGAICAAPTTSLPEDIGGVRNWDYRYTWIRDAAFTVQALVNLNHTTEARRYIDWFTDLCYADEPQDLQPLYGLHGERELGEQELSHLEGYRCSSPVRIGNEAADQRQLDTFGELVLAIYEATENGMPITEADWTVIREVVDHVCQVWSETDAGIWEVRSEPRHFVFSKVMCWVAIDRGLALARDQGFDAPEERWHEHRTTIKEEVLTRGFDDGLNSFVRSYDSTALDATGLLIPMVGFLPFDDPRVQGTIEATKTHLLTDECLVHRYDGDDGLPGEEGTFVLCTFWLVDVLALSGRVTEAERIFTELLEFVSPLGLLAEEIDSQTGAQLGNFPQAFSHIGLINSALYLGIAQGRKQRGAPPLGTEWISE